MKFLVFIVVTSLFAISSCTIKKSENKKLKYFSVQKWLETKSTSYPTEFNFYSFQGYLNKILSDSAHCKFHSQDYLGIEALIQKFLEFNCNIYHSDLLKKINKLNFNFDRDSAIIAINLMRELDDSIALLSKGSLFCIQGGWGSGITSRENYLIKFEKGSIKIISTLPQGILRGVKVDENCHISHLIFEDFSRSYNDDNYHHGEVMFELKIYDNKIAFSKILNVRRGEDIDYSDKHNFFDEIKSYYFSTLPHK